MPRKREAEHIREQAEKLAKRHYNAVVYRDSYQDGTFSYLVVNPEFDRIIRPRRCQASGATLDEAFKNVVEARIEIIEELLKAKQQVPYPNNMDMSGNTMSGDPYYNPANTLYMTCDMKTGKVTYGAPGT
jgi:predicted RNase H-like HicB family nuclease